MDVKTILIERGIRATRSLGQYFLIDDGVTSRMVEYAGVVRGDVVLEIGAGVGSVTEELERRAKKVYAVEKDKELCELLRERYGNKKSITEVIEGDFAISSRKVRVNVTFNFYVPFSIPWRQSFSISKGF